MNNSNKYIKGTNLTLLQFSLLLILSSATARLASSLYLPALLKIGEDLQLSDAILGETLTIFFVAFAIATLFVGPLTDCYGRKFVIILGSFIFIIGSLLCANAFSWNVLIAGRIFQATGASCIPVAGRAMIRDLCDDTQVIAVLGWMAVIGGLTPIVAPVLGGVITQNLGWRYNFWLLILFAIIATLFIAYRLPRSIAKEDLHLFNIKSILLNYKHIITSPKFFTVITPLALAFAIQGAYLGTSPFIFMKTFKLTPIQYGLINIIVVGSLFLGRYVSSGVMKYKSIYTAYLTGGTLTLIGGALLHFFVIYKIANLWSVLITLSIAITGFGTLLPIGIKSIMTAFREKAGTASALHGCLTLGMASFGCFIASELKHIYKYSSLECIEIFMFPTAILIVLSALATKKHLQ
jgi:DHA1 family bicyclomycin/chloramphenicol resistance-like MFS transporter